MIHDRLPCGAIFDYMDYLQPDANNWRRASEINTGVALQLAVCASWFTYFAWFLACLINFGMARKRLRNTGEKFCFCCWLLSHSLQINRDILVHTVTIFIQLGWSVSKFFSKKCNGTVDFNGIHFIYAFYTEIVSSFQYLFSPIIQDSPAAVENNRVPLSYSLRSLYTFFTHNSHYLYYTYTLCTSEQYFWSS